MPGNEKRDMAKTLRAKALDHPTVQQLEDQLPELGDEPAPGLYLETRTTPGLVVNGEMRVSVARLHSVDEEDTKLLGQIQAVREVDHPLKEWRLKLYWHQPDHFCTEHVEDPETWFLQVLDQHYLDAGAAPDLPIPVEA